MSTFSFWNDPGSTLHPASAMDFLPAPQLRALQLHRLQNIARHTFDNVAFAREKMSKAGFSPDNVKTLADIEKIPFSVKADLRDTYPYGLFAVPMSEVVRLHASSGTTGKPIVVGYTAGDMRVWANVVLRALAAVGVTSGDVLHNAYGYGLFTGGLGLHGGAEAMGCTVIPVSGGNTDRQLMILRDFGVTAISCTPSYFLHILDEAEKKGVDMRALPLRTGIFGAEPWTEEMRRRIEQAAGIKAYDIYGLTEIIGPGVSMECQEQCGPHIFEDHFYPEIIDPETGAALPDGEVGELVLTTLSKAATPMLRYRTRDLSRLVAEPCACGRTLRRLERVSARSDDMLIIRGVNLFPSQIEAALLSVEQALPHYHIIVSRKDDLDQIEVQVEITPSVASDDIRSMQHLRQRIVTAIEHVTNLRVNVSLVQPNTLQRSEGKARRVTDLRKL
ncbi:MAG: phenylacetate--CoA ligase [Kiritimatiellaeota bacterium]|nr:phenylacetate--CoA ligase [Kiritimatiellota bacterium]